MIAPVKKNFNLEDGQYRLPNLNRISTSAGLHITARLSSSCFHSVKHLVRKGSVLSNSNSTHKNLHPYLVAPSGIKLHILPRSLYINLQNSCRALLLTLRQLEVFDPNPLSGHRLS